MFIKFIRAGINLNELFIWNVNIADMQVLISSFDKIKNVHFECEQSEASLTPGPAYSSEILL